MDYILNFLLLIILFILLIIMQKKVSKKKIINCCFSEEKHKDCMRESDKKIFELPRRFSKTKCIQGPIKGFTMRSSCAPYMDCKENENFSNIKGGDQQLNLNNKNLEICSLDPLTGWFRNGKCQTDENDHGSHLVCSKMTKEFLDYTKEKGNDLSSVVKPGQNWCLCQYRWNQAFKDGTEPPVLKSSTNNLITSDVKKNIEISLKKDKHKQFLYDKENPTETFDLYHNTNPSDTINISYNNLNSLRLTIYNLEKLFQNDKYSHKRISQVVLVIKNRLLVIKKISNNSSKEYNRDLNNRIELIESYQNFLKQRTNIKPIENRKKLVFKNDYIK